MALLRNLLSRRLHSNLNPFTSHTLHSSTPHSFNIKTPHRPLASLPQTQDPVSPKPQTQHNRKPLSALFTEAVELSGKTTTSDDEKEEKEQGVDAELKKKLRELADVVRSFKEKRQPERKSLDAAFTKQPERKSLYAVFTNQPASVVSTQEEVKQKEPMVVKELSPDMMVFVKYLFENGYFKDANFAKGKVRFDPAWFERFFARGYIKFAAQKFARDNQEIAKWLSGSALKQVAEFGCPSTDRSNVFTAKRLRKFLEVPENTVCSKCTLRQSCKYENQSVWKCDTNKLDLVIVMKVITSYALELVHPQLVVSDQVNKSVSQLLKEVVKLSQTT